MKRLVIGILAHVDAGKTTLSEGILYESGKIRKVGRVDNGDAYLDTDTIEKERGITVFSKQAVFNYGNAAFTLLDTPGHIDFAAEAERTLQVLDYAVLVISASDGVQAHTETLWHMLKRHNIPTFIFVNKMDLPDTDADTVEDNLKSKLGLGCVNFCKDMTSDDFYDSVTMCSEDITENYLETGEVSDECLSNAINNREIFPVYFGSALKLEGISQLLEGISKYSVMPKYPESFGAKVFKISDDGKGKRLAHMKITGGCLSVKDTPKDDPNQKINEIRIYSGEKYINESTVYPGTVCAVTGLSDIKAGEGLGIKEKDGVDELMTEPVFAYTVIINDKTDTHKVLEVFKKLEEEETRLHVVIDNNGNIQIRLMGKVQLEIIQRIVKERFGIDISLEKGGVVYRETIADKIEGVGHYEPLRHYAEVHLLLEPLPKGSGVKFAAKCSEDMLDKSKQRLVLTHLEEKPHIGVLTGSPINDIKITLIAGKAHLKHTEGGDFRQATYRAVRNGLMRGKSILQEPWYDFKIEVPSTSAGRVMTDINCMGGRMETPESTEDTTVITGCAPAAKIADYGSDLIGYTKGKGRINLKFAGYEECKDSEYVIDDIGYMAEADTENTGDSVFCDHGAGFNVKWDKVFDYMHLPPAELEPKTIEVSNIKTTAPRKNVDDAELMRIFENTYGEIKRREDDVTRPKKKASSAEYIYKPPKNPKNKIGNENYLLVDGYNVIFSWKDLKKLSEDDLDFARTALINRLCAYASMTSINIIAVFDAYKVKGNTGSVEKINNISVVYTKEAETADSYIEKTTEKLKRKGSVRVATSDFMEQLIILGNGALRITPDELLAEVEDAENKIREIIAKDL